MGGFWLEDDAGDGGWSAPAMVGQSGTLENSQCIVDAGASSLQLSGTSLTITVAVSFKTGYAGPHTVWEQAVDNENFSTGGYYPATGYMVTTRPAPLFSLAAQPVTAQPIAPGSSAGYTVTVTPQSGFSGVVKFENTALAAGETATFTPASVSGGSGTATLTVNTDSQATPTGSINFSVIGMGQQGGGWVETQTSATLDVEILNPPPAVTLASPLNNASNQGITPALSWNAAVRASSYDVYLYPASGTPTKVATVTATTYTPSPALAANATYSWYVIAKNASGAAPASPTWSFTTVAASLTILSTHTGAFTQGQSNATYTLTVTNGASAGATTGAVAVTETAPSGLIPVSMQGAGWTCTGPTCVRNDALATGSSYPAIALTVDVATTAPASVTNTATVSGGGSLNASASDPTTIDALPRYSNPLAFATTASVIAGAPTTFTVTYASQAGSADIASGQVQIDGCYLGWDRSGNITLYPSTSGTLGQNATLSAGSCSINLANSSLSPVPGNPDALTLSLAITFSEQSNGTDFFGTHEVCAWGTNAESLETAAVDLGALVVSPGQDYTLTVSPSGTTTVPYMGTVTLTVTATALNGFTGQINLQIGLAPGTTNPCFSLWGSIPYLTANSQGSFTLQNNCPSGGFLSQFVITGSAPSIGVSRAGSSNPVLNPAPGGDFTITPGMPTPSNLPAGSSISYQVTATSIGSQSGNVNFTLAPPAGGSMPAGVTYQFAPAQVYLSGGGTGQSTLTLSSTSSTPGGTFPLVITGTLGGAQRTAAFSLGTQVTGFQVTSATGSAIVHNTGQEVQVTHSVPAGNAPGYATCSSADPDVSCRVISTSSGTVTLGITATTSAVHGTRVLNLNGGAATTHAAVGNHQPSGVSVSPSSIQAGQWTAVTVAVTGADLSCGVNEDCIPEVDVTDSQGLPVTWATFDFMSMLLYADPPVDWGGSPLPLLVWWDLCDAWWNPEDQSCLFPPISLPPGGGGGGGGAPVLSLSGPQNVKLGNTGIFTINSSSSQPLTLQLTLSRNSGTAGSAQFQNGGTSTTVNVGAGSEVDVTVTGTQLSSDANNITLTATAQGFPPATAQFTVVPTPCHMVVQGDYITLCASCTHTIERAVTYSIVGSDWHTSVGSGLPLCEDVSRTWSTTDPRYPDPVLATNKCSGPDMALAFTKAGGTFQDSWTVRRDSYPAGVGYDNVTDTWKALGGNGIWSPTGNNNWVPIGVLQGFDYTDAIQINGITKTLQDFRQGNVWGMDKGTQIPGGCQP